MFPLASQARHAPAPTPTVTPSRPPEDPVATQIARREFVAWQAGIVDPSRYAKESQAGLTPDRVTDISKQLGGAGSLQSVEWVEPVVVEGMPDVHGYLYKMTCSNAVVYERLILSPDRKTIDSVVFMDKLPPH
ncbi:MAG TPA: hypothetical protein VFN49_06470 [Candidatus Aquilonibacter sp.]|nr:hypothetical protein [Candidatus Aquilonibacter sp.]